jgi:hypothetical protein
MSGEKFQGQVYDKEVNAGLWWGKPYGKGSLEDIGFDGRIIFKCIFKKLSGSLWIGLILLRTGTHGPLL